MYIAPPGKGRRKHHIQWGATRPLTAEDIQGMWDTREKTFVDVPRLKALRHNHHMVARAIASGKSLMECSRISGLSVHRISDLKNDPAFRELVQFYSDELQEIYVNVHERMAVFGTSVLEELQERFEEEPEKFTKRELMELFTTMADRSIPTAKGGPSPQQAAMQGGGNGLALQINFVSPDQTATLDLTASPEPAAKAAPLPQIDVAPVSPPAPEFSPLPPARALDMAPPPAHHEAIAEARRAAAEAAAAKRQEEAERRDALREEFRARRLSQQDL